MEVDIPSAADLRARLLPLGHSQLQKLAIDSGVPFTTLWKIRSGETRNPGIDTARRFYPLVKLQEAKHAA